MSTLDFLSPDRAASELGFRPLLHSPLERHLQEAGATFEERDGWLVPVSVPGEEERLASSVGLVDLSHLGKLEVRGTGGAEEGRDVLAWYRVRPDLSLVLSPPASTFLLRSTLGRRFRLVLDQTGAYAVLGVVGPRARDLMRRLTHLHEFPASGSLAHVTAHVLERDGQYWVVHPQEYGHYVWEVAADAAEPFGGGPVGVDAIAGGRS